MNVLIKLFLFMTVFSVSISTLEAATAEAADADVPDGYQIGPGDVLNISVWKEDDLKKQLLVKPDGAITFPLAGEVVASGLTTEELTEILANKLKRFIPSPVVTVTVVQASSLKIYVVGKVVKPGQYIATHYMDVLQAISLAGGVTAFADTDDIKIIRKTGDKRQVFMFDYDDAIEGENLDANIELKAGDTVVVP